MPGETGDVTWAFVGEVQSQASRSLRRAGGLSVCPPHIKLSYGRHGQETVKGHLKSRILSEDTRLCACVRTSVVNHSTCPAARSLTSVFGLVAFESQRQSEYRLQSRPHLKMTVSMSTLFPGHLVLLLQIQYYNVCITVVGISCMQGRNA